MENHKSQRFYWMTVKQDLFGNWCIHKIYGGLHNNHHHSILTPCVDKNEAYKLLAKFEQIRLKRGYIHHKSFNP